VKHEKRKGKPETIALARGLRRMERTLRDHESRIKALENDESSSDDDDEDEDDDEEDGEL